jgi:hypothetical protein
MSPRSHWLSRKAFAFFASFNGNQSLDMAAICPGTIRLDQFFSAPRRDLRKPSCVRQSDASGGTQSARTNHFPGREPGFAVGIIHLGRSPNFIFTLRLILRG